MTSANVSSVFSFEVRLLACPNCGAPQTVPAAGGIVRCAHCAMSSEYRARPRAPAEAQPGSYARDTSSSAPSARESTEQERLARLRQQVNGNPSALAPAWPPALARLVAVRGIEPRLAALEGAWRSACRAVRANPRSDAASLLYVLAVGLAIVARRAGDRSRERLVLETSLELARDVRQASVLRGMLVEAAAKAGELAEARTWLSSCDAHSADLAVDTEFRIASAFIARATNRPEEILAQVGATSSAVPIAEHRASLAALCRIHALAELGRRGEAVTEYSTAAGKYGGKHLTALAAAYPELDVHGVVAAAAATNAQARLALCALFFMVAAVAGAGAASATGYPLAGICVGGGVAAAFFILIWSIKPTRVFGYERP